MRKAFIVLAVLALAAPAAALLAFLDLEAEVSQRLTDRAASVASTECPDPSAGTCPELLAYARRVNSKVMQESRVVAYYLVTSESGTFTGCGVFSTGQELRAVCTALPSSSTMDTLVSAAFDDQAALLR